MVQTADLACQLLRLEQQLKAYQKLHTDELAELWRALDECKQTIAVITREQADGPAPAAARGGEARAHDEDNDAPEDLAARSDG